MQLISLNRIFFQGSQSNVYNFALQVAALRALKKKHTDYLWEY